MGHAEIPDRQDSRGTSMPIQSVNDFVVRFANVNGSGSASANELFARAVLRMGVPVAPRNIFPSNIQGLPTWYEVRISQAGHLGARGGTDLMVAMNPQTWDKDVAGIEPGGYLLYDSTKPMPKTKFRDAITAIGIPLTAIANIAIRASGNCSRTSSISARSRHCSTWMSAKSRSSLPSSTKARKNCSTPTSTRSIWAVTG